MAILNSFETERRYEKRFGINNVHKLRFKLILVLLGLNCVNLVEGNEEPSVDDLNKLDFNTTARYFENVYSNGTFHTGNMLWDQLLNQCSAKPSVSCLQKNVYTYLDDSLGFNGDINVANGVKFIKNKVDINKYSKEANIIYLKGNKEEQEVEEGKADEDNEIDDEESETPLEEVTDALYDKSVQFLVTHDMKLQLPEIFFHGATLKISPRALTKSGALVHLDLIPKDNEFGQGRIFFKKIKKYLRKKLIMAAIAIILVVKLIALKLVFVLPVVMGITTAKKIILKILLFFFPALSHIFKLCSWYHQSYHTTKFHHHHHLITHHHKQPHHSYGHSSSHHPSSLTVSHPHSHEGPSFEHYPQDWELSGPGLGNEYLAAGIHRNAIANFKPHENDVHDIKAWGLALPPGTASLNVGEISSQSLGAPVSSPPNNHRPHGHGPHSRPVGPPSNPYHRSKKVVPKDKVQVEKEALIRAAALAARAPPSPVRDEVLRVSAAKLSETTRVQTETELVRKQQEILAAMDPETQAAEKFYGPMVERVEKILTPMGAFEPGCKERAICTLYKDPFQHTPYSNLVSNELSKDSKELLPPADSKFALRYYKYVQAARNGQENKDCINVHKDCNIDFNKK